VVAAAGGLAVRGGWRGLSRYLLAAGCGIVCARLVALAAPSVQALTMALGQAPVAVPGMLTTELFTHGTVVT
jgi:hypothetical protein